MCIYNIICMLMIKYIMFVQVFVCKCMNYIYMCIYCVCVYIYYIYIYTYNIHIIYKHMNTYTSICTI